MFIVTLHIHIYIYIYMPSVFYIPLCLPLEGKESFIGCNKGAHISTVYHDYM